MTGGSKHRKAKVILALVTTLLMLIVLEAALQLVIRVREGQWLSQVLEGSRVPWVTPVADRRQYVLTPNYQGLKGSIRVDARGFRHIDYQCGDTAPVVICAGDSVPFGFSVFYKQAYPYYLAELFEHHNMTLQVVNAGIPSYNLRQALDHIRLGVLKQYDVSRLSVITLQAANDVFLLSYYRENWDPDITWSYRRYLHQVPLLRKSAFLHLGAIAWHKLFGTEEAAPLNPGTRLRRGQKNSNYEGERKKYDTFAGTRMVENARDVLEKELARYEDDPIHIVLMPIDPFYYQISGQEKNPTLPTWRTKGEIAAAIYDLVESYNRMLIDFAAAHEKVHYFDTRVLMDAQDRAKMYIEHIHYSAKGNRIIARGLFDFLQDRRLLPRQVVGDGMERQKP